MQQIIVPTLPELHPSIRENFNVFRRTQEGNKFKQISLYEIQIYL